MIADQNSRTTGDTPPIPRRILGVRVDDVTWDEALRLVGTYIGSGGAHIVVTPNPEIVMAARRDARLGEIVRGSDLATADGVGLRWAGKLLRQPIRQVVPGSDLVVGMAEQSARLGHRWFLLGAAPGIAERAGAALSQRFPGLTIAGTHGGSPDPAHDAEALRQIDACQPIDVLLVAYGAPAQEVWMARNAEAVGVPVSMGVGGTFNFLAGESKLPPAAVKRLGLIWLWRLVTEPWRWRRQLTLVRFVGAVLTEAVRMRIHGAKHDAAP